MRKETKNIEKDNKISFMSKYLKTWMKWIVYSKKYTFAKLIKEEIKNLK